MTSQPLLIGLSALVAVAACSDSRVALQQRLLHQPSVAASEIIISRVMADPVAVSDERGEWVEIANLGGDSTDLRGWQLRSARDPGFTVPRSLVVPPGGSVILGRSADSSSNGGVHVDLAYTGIVLGNAGDWLVLRDPSGITVDSVEWDVAPKGTAIDHRGDRGTKQVAPSTPATTPIPEPAPRSPSSTAPATPGAIRAAASPKELVVRVLDVGQGEVSRRRGR